MKELAPHVAPRWYMFAVLLNISKPIVDRISRSFNVHGSFHCCLSEVVEAWLEEMNVASHKMACHILTDVEHHKEAGDHSHSPGRFCKNVPTVKLTNAVNLNFWCITALGKCHFHEGQHQS